MTISQSWRWLTATAMMVIITSASGCDTPDDLAMPTVELPSTKLPRSPYKISQPASLRGIRVGTDAEGRPIRVDCMSCHAVRDEYDVPATDSIEGLENVHAGMFYRHGAMTCRSCHDPERADRLRLADGRTIEMAEALQLCAQCHGPQVRDWQAGSHGGMRGYWDRRRGTATKNHCLDCHDPHDPRFPTWEPLPPTRDRFVTIDGDEEDHDG